VSGLFRQAIGVIEETQSIREAKAWSSTIPVVLQIIQIISSNEFQTVSLAALVLILLIVIFLPDGCLTYSVSFITGFVVWLFFSVQIPAWSAITLAIALLIALLILFDVMITIATGAPEGCLTVFGMGLVLILVMGSIAVWWFWWDLDYPVSAKWILGPATSLFTFIIIALSGGFQPEK